MKSSMGVLGALVMLTGSAQSASANWFVTDVKQIANDSGAIVQIINQENHNDDRQVAAQSIANTGALWVSWHSDKPLEIKTEHNDYLIYQEGEHLFISSDGGRTWTRWEDAKRNLIIVVTHDEHLLVQDAP
jgi:hypothetical protein